MTPSELLQQRLANQQVSQQNFTNVHDSVAWLGAVQAQDYPGALWSIGLRLPGSTQKDIEEAIINRQIVRTWPMRGTLHFVAAEDIRWMLELMTPKVIRGAASRYRQLGLDEPVFERCRNIFTQALAGDKQLSRSAMYALLEEHGITSTGQRGLHILCRLCQEGLLCFAVHNGKEPSFALLNEWILSAQSKSREESLAEIVKRYFNSHGPATIQDFMGWTGLTMADTRIGLELNKNTLTSLVINDITYWLNSTHSGELTGSSLYLLPGFDEYLLGYKDRHLALDLIHNQRIVPGNNGMFLSTIVIDGKVEGLWKRVAKPKKVTIALSPFTKLTAKNIEKLHERARLYGTFIEKEVEILAT